MERTTRGPVALSLGLSPSLTAACSSPNTQSASTDAGSTDVGNVDSAATDSSPDSVIPDAVASDGAAMDAGAVDTSALGVGAIDAGPPKGSSMLWAQCSKYDAVCSAKGSKSEGWYDSCTKKLLRYDNCDGQL